MDGNAHVFVRYNNYRVNLLTPFTMLRVETTTMMEDEEEHEGTIIISANAKLSIKNFSAIKRQHNLLGKSNNNNYFLS